MLAEEDNTGYKIGSYKNKSKSSSNLRHEVVIVEERQMPFIEIDGERCYVSVSELYA